MQILQMFVVYLKTDLKLSGRIFKDRKMGINIFIIILLILKLNRKPISEEINHLDIRDKNLTKIYRQIQLFQEIY